MCAWRWVGDEVFFAVTWGSNYCLLYVSHSSLFVSPLPHSARKTKERSTRRSFDLAFIRLFARSLSSAHTSTPSTFPSNPPLLSLSPSCVMKLPQIHFIHPAQICFCNLVLQSAHPTTLALAVMHIGDPSALTCWCKAAGKPVVRVVDARTDIVSSGWKDLG